MAPGYLMCLLGALFGVGCQGKKILLMAPPSPSHMQQLLVTGDELTRRGHVTVFVAPSVVKDFPVIAKSKVRIIWHETSKRVIEFSEKEAQTEHLRLALTAKIPLSAVMLSLSHFQPWCDSVVQDQKLLQELRNEEFDFAVVDGVFLGLCNYIVLDQLQVPYATVIPMTLADQVTTTLSFPSLKPVWTGSEAHSFSSRVFETAMNAAIYLFMLAALPPSTSYQKYCRSNPCKSFTQLQADSKIWLLDLDELLNVPAPSMPHVFNVGGLSLQKPEALTGEFEKIASAAKDSLVLISFGTNVSYLDKIYISKIMDALKSLPQFTFIFRMKTKLEHVPNNVKVFPWLPQRDILTHENMRLFITHCGVAGLHETLYAGVPILGIPFFGDQPMNAQKMTDRGFGLHLSIVSMTSAEMAAAITELISNPAYRNNIQKKSKIYRSKEFAVKRAADVIEHVLEHGSDHLQPPFKDLYWFQLLMFDVAAFFLLCLLVPILGCVFCCRKCRGGNRKEKAA